MKGRNRDWKIKSNSFVIGEKKDVSCRSKMNFIILELFGRSHKSGGEQKLIKNLYP
jgi:hypothetical protein